VPAVSYPFAIDGPAVVSFSGGRTSGMMLRRILDLGLRRDVHILFANTGKEREETLQFVHDCETRWSAPVVWLERSPVGSYQRVTFATASRHGEPFEQLITLRRFLPNPVTRFCTTELKIRVMKAFMLDAGYEHWTNVVGLRADEPGRVARQREMGGRERWDVACPLYDAGIDLAAVDAFWRAQPFDLALRPWEGNCDLCFLKGRAKRERIMRDRPDLAGWWLEQEARNGATFRADAPGYAKLLDLSKRPLLFTELELDGQALDDLGDCVCAGAA
jgi:hypothetical protein